MPAPTGRRLLAAAALTATVLLQAACSAGAPTSGTTGVAASLASGSDPVVADDSVTPGQTSEGIEGERVAPYPDGYLPRPRVSNVRTWSMAPGVTYRRWTQTDRRGDVRAHLVRVRLGEPGVSLDYQSMPHVPERDTVSGLLARDKALAGVNGGFFDISDTGAPLGVGQDRQRGFLHAAAYTWRNAFWIDRDGESHIGTVPLAAAIEEYPQMEVTNVNSPRVREGKIGIWDSRWGETSGYSITDGQRKRVRMVVVEDGRVVANTGRLSSGREITGTVLVGRGPGADQLEQLPVGSSATVRWSLDREADFALGGETVLLRRGRVKVSDDRILHPRTAVGIDQDTGRVLLLAVDGRAPHSRGLTLVEEARMLKQRGADVALNLDGGGSTTMAGLTRKGRLRVLNKPSDGSQRIIPDAIAVQFRRPR